MTNDEDHTSHSERQKDEAIPLNMLHDEVSNEVDITTVLPWGDIGDDTL